VSIGIQAAVVAVGGTPPAVACCAGSCRLDVTLPALSVTTIALR
jgi:hypothetical protein